MLPAKAPLVYISGTFDGNATVALELEKLIPVSKTVEVQHQGQVSTQAGQADAKRQVRKSISAASAKGYSAQDTAIIFAETIAVDSAQASINACSFVARQYQAAAIKHGRDFVCIVLVDGLSRGSVSEHRTTTNTNPTELLGDRLDDVCAFGGPNHLKLHVEGLSATAVAKKVYEHLCKSATKCIQTQLT